MKWSSRGPHPAFFVEGTTICLSPPDGQRFLRLYLESALSFAHPSVPPESLPGGQYC